MSKRVVGRLEELAALEGCIAELADGARAVALSGEPGIGKTRLLIELESFARTHRYLVLAGRASELESDLPYWLFVDALDDYLRSLGPTRDPQIDARLGAELSRIFPALAGFGDPDDTVLDERYRAHDAVRELLERIAAVEPLVLILDDLRWADPASIDLVSGLLRRPPRARVLLALALRPHQTPRRLAAALDKTEKSGLLRRLTLGPISEQDAALLLGQNVPVHVLKALYRESDGNPFYLEQLARAWQRAPHLPPGAGLGLESMPATMFGEAGVPVAVAAALEEELNLLSSPARALLQGAAVVGDPFEFALASAAAGLPEDEAFQGLDELCRLDLVRSADTPQRFRFRHPLIRHATYSATQEGWRLAAHSRAAAALAGRREPVATLAHHLVYCARRGDRGAIAVLSQAADACAERAPASAARWYRAALDLFIEEDADEQRLQILEALAGVLAGLGQFGDSRRTLLTLLELVPPDMTGRRVRLMSACAAVEHLMGQHESARARLASALEQLPDGGSADAAEVMLELAADAFYRGDYEGMREWAGESYLTARALDLKQLVAAASAAASAATAFTGRVQEAVQHRARAAALIDGLQDNTLSARLDAVSHLVVAEIYLDHYHDAVVHARRGLKLARSSGQGQLFPQLTHSQGVGLVMLGRLAEAIDIFDGAIDAARLSENPQLLAWALFNRSWAALMRGELDSALETSQESIQLTRNLDDSMLSPFVEGMLGSILIEAGEPAHGLDLLFAATGGPEISAVPGVWRTIFSETATRALLEMRRPSDAEQTAYRAEKLAATLGLDSATAVALRARAAVKLASGDRVGAAEAALASAAAAERICAPIDAARARVLAGRALAAGGDRVRAAAELNRAADAFESCGALRYRGQAENVLRRLGRPFRRRQYPAPTEGDAIDSLTPREREIAELIGEQRTNREIAGELFVSEKTVETHLRNIFAKLGISSRTAIPRFLKGASNRFSETRRGAS